MGLAAAITFFANSKTTRGGKRGGELPNFSPKKVITVNSITSEWLIVRGPYFRGTSGRSTRTFPEG